MCIRDSRYTALLGGTTEWTKMEGMAINAKDKKLYMAMSRIESSMRSDPTEPADHIKLPENKAGATYTPVSYTHLDVYKRQLMIDPALPGTAGDASGNLLPDSCPAPAAPAVGRVIFYDPDC